MPYINQAFREELYPAARGRADVSGDLTYQLACLCLDYLADRTECYQAYSDIVGALECCKLEMYRRAVAPYEDKKIKENGDVY